MSKQGGPGRESANQDTAPRPGAAPAKQAEAKLGDLHAPGTRREFGPENNPSPSMTTRETVSPAGSNQDLSPAEHRRALNFVDIFAMGGLSAVGVGIAGVGIAQGTLGGILFGAFIAGASLYGGYKSLSSRRSSDS
jgi:hypothetical protein